MISALSVLKEERSIRIALNSTTVRNNPLPTATSIYCSYKELFKSCTILLNSSQRYRVAITYFILKYVQRKKGSPEVSIELETL